MYLRKSYLLISQPLYNGGGGLSDVITVFISPRFYFGQARFTLFGKIYSCSQGRVLLFIQAYFMRAYCCFLFFAPELKITALISESASRACLRAAELVKDSRTKPPFPPCFSRDSC